MGGGMGGMGGGGGGMGMFNVPRELLPANHPLNLLPKIPPGGFKAFSVKDDLSDAKIKDNPHPKASPKPKFEKIPLEIPADSSASQYWDKYFSAHSPESAAVRDAVRRLMYKKKYDQAIAFLSAVLRSPHPQPWMYEALALAMQAADKPKEEIERAVMSAVVFCNNSDDLLYLGAYLMRLGINGRALDIFRQVAQQDPLRPEPYMLGLKAARELNDLDGLRWASLGIINQAWTKDQVKVWQAGVGVAKEVLERLQKENKKEAAAFRKELDQAMIRDCVVVVRWTGDADVDLYVEEPGGSVCSLRNPRTTSGGILAGDVLSQTPSDSAGAHSQVYVCPRGFDGKYRVLLWRVFGKVVSGKVSVEIVTHYGTKNSSSLSKKIPLEKEKSMVVFDLKDGRRKESIHQQQIASAASSQLAINQQIVAQQIASSIDSHAMNSLYDDRSRVSTGAAGPITNGQAGRFIALGGAPGYQPVIIFLPKGTQFRATAVVSADRRYVRVTPSPIFSAVTEVSTFNMASGETGTSSGSGNSGFSGGAGGGGPGGGGGAF
ncbi:MAG: hypothetical protein ACWGMZ_12240, partial [Thermoguttaceae bacterium]